MTIRPMDLAHLMLEKIKEEPSLTEYFKVSEVPLEEGEISLAELFYHMDNYYNKAATMKSALLFLSENVGIEKEYCILVLAIADETLYNVVAKIINEDTEGFLIARAKTAKDAQTLINYFSISNWACGLITEKFLPASALEAILSKCKDLPTCVIGPCLSIADYVGLLAKGVNVIVETNESPALEKNIQTALIEMFLD